MYMFMFIYAAIALFSGIKGVTTSMGRNCCIIGCTNSTYRLNQWYSRQCRIHRRELGFCECNPPFTLFPFPTENRDPEGRRRWIQKVNRITKEGDPWQPTYQDRVCSSHFREDRPTPVWPDPTEHLGYHLGTELIPQGVRRLSSGDQVWQKVKAKRKKTKDADEEVAMKSMVDPESRKKFLRDHDYFSADHVCPDCNIKEVKIFQLEADVRKLQRNLKIKSKTCSSDSISKMVLKSDKNVKEYTGIENKQQFESLYAYLKPRVEKVRYWVRRREGHLRSSLKGELNGCPQNPGPTRTLSSKQELILVLLKLKLALSMSFLASLFNVTECWVWAIFSTWAKFLACELKPLVFWPDKGSIESSVPISLCQGTRCTLKCTEISIERPRNWTLQACTWSEYKKNNTVKFLVAIAPNGMISFVSDVWGGQTSDAHIARESGFLNLIDPGDVVLTDRDFITEDLLLRGAKLALSVSNQGKELQTPDETPESMRAGNARIHFEHVVDGIKCFGILQQTIPLTLLPLIDDIILVCAALVNLRPAFAE